jgi:hypothetical protein
MSGPCLLMRPQGPLPAGCSWERSRYAEAQTSTSAVAAAVCVRWCHLRLSIARAMTQGRRHPGRQKSVSRRQQSVSTVSITRHAATFCTALAA